MELIKDLGTQFPKPTSKIRKRYGLYECPVCFKVFKTQTSSVNSGKTTKCKSCAITISNTSHGKSETKLFRIWVSRINKWKKTHVYYDPSWNEFKNFEKDMESSFIDGTYLSLKQLGTVYCKNNCLWDTKRQYTPKRAVRKRNTPPPIPLNPNTVIKLGEGITNNRVRAAFNILEENLFKVHGKDKYSYHKSIYYNSATLMDVFCNTCNKFFPSSPGMHMQGIGCPSCAKYGFDPSSPGMLYYFKVTDGTNMAWKIGITNYSIARRYQVRDQLKITDLVTVWFEIGQNAYNKEQSILKQFREFKYNGPNLLKSGNTELFNIDISTKVDFKLK